MLMSITICNECGNKLANNDQTCDRCGASTAVLMDLMNSEPMVVGTFTSHSSRYASRRLLFLNQTFTIEGVGQIDARHLPAMADQGEITWAREELDPWVRDWSSYTATKAQVESIGNPSSYVIIQKKHSKGAAIALIAVGTPLVIVGVALCLTVIGAIVGIPLCLIGGAMVGVGVNWLTR
jgi:hypothetical protein